MIPSISPSPYLGRAIFFKAGERERLSRVTA